MSKIVTRRRAMAVQACALHRAVSAPAFIARDMATWAEVVKATGTKPGT